jgi:hypothetical protein
MLKVVDSIFMEYLIKEDLQEKVCQYMDRSVTKTSTVYVTNFFDGFNAAKTDEGPSYWDTAELEFKKYKENCMLQLLLKNLGVAVGVALVDKLAPEITNTLSEALDDLSSKTSQMFNDVFSSNDEEEEENTLAVEVQKPKRVMDKFMFTREDHDYICQEYAAHNTMRKELGYRVPYRILVANLNKHFGLHKSSTSYSNIWTNGVDRDSLPTEATKKLFGD